LLKPILKNNISLLAQYASGALMPLVLLPRFAHILGLEVFGKIAILLAWASYATALIHYAFNLTGPARAARIPANKWPLLVSTLLQARFLLLALALLFIAFIYFTGLITFEAPHYYLLIIFVLSLASACETTWFLQFSDRFTEIAAFSIVGNLIAMLFGFLFVQGPDPLSAIWACIAICSPAISTSLGSLLLTIIDHGVLPIASRTEVLGALNDGRPLFMSQVVALAYGGLGPIVLGSVSGVSEAGSYTVISKVVMSLSMATDLVYTSTYPMMTRMYLSNRLLYLVLARRIFMICFLMSMLIGILGWYLHEPVLNYLFGFGGPSQYNLYFICLGWIVVGNFGSAVTGYFALSSQPKISYKVNLIVMVITLSIGIPAASTLGAPGWVAGIIIGQLYVVLVAISYWRREHEKLA